MALFAIRDKTEAISRGWPPELDTKKSEGGLLAPTSAGGFGMNGALCHSAKTEATSRGWPPELDTKKSEGGLLAPTSAGGVEGNVPWPQ